MSHSRKFSAVIISLALLGACATPLETASTNIALDEANFYGRINAGRMHLAEANLWVSLAECGDIGVVTIESEESLSSTQAMQKAAEKIDRQLRVMGANTYAVQSLQWLNAATLRLEIKSLICSD